MSVIKSIKQVLGLSGTASENHFWDGSVPNQLSLKRGTPDAPGVELIKALNGALSFPNQGQSLAANGYVKLPGGLIIQWGTGSIAVDGNGQSITYPIPFPNGVLSLHAQSLAGASVITMSVQIVDVRYFNIWAGVGTPGFTWIAIGY